MNDQEIRMECLRLALGSMPIPGLPEPGYKSESVLQIAEAYCLFIYGSPIKAEPKKAA